MIIIIAIILLIIIIIILITTTPIPENLFPALMGESWTRIATIMAPRSTSPTLAQRLQGADKAWTCFRLDECSPKHRTVSSILTGSFSTLVPLTMFFVIFFCLTISENVRMEMVSRSSQTVDYPHIIMLETPRYFLYLFNLTINHWQTFCHSKGCWTSNVGITSDI